MGDAQAGDVARHADAQFAFEAMTQVVDAHPHRRGDLVEAVRGAEAFAQPGTRGFGMAAASRMAGVAFSGPLMAELGANRWVAIFGLGMVGNLAAQICRIMGARVIGIDPSPARRALAQRCGIPHVLGGDAATVERELRALTGEGPAIVFDAVGNGEVCAQAVRVAAPFGQIVVLGTPRKPVQGDLSAVFAAIHGRWLTVRGALEWNLPTYPVIGLRDSLLSKQLTLLDWIARGELQFGELISHRLPPAAISEAYEGLRRKPDEYTGVLLDWRKPIT